MNRPHAPLSPILSQLLGRLRRQIRWFIWLEALAVLTIWVGTLFWVGLALDYVPVWLGAGEMPRVARMAVLAIIGLGICWLGYRYLLRRVFTTLPDRHLALLIERRFPELNDALLTVVDNTDPRARPAKISSADELSSRESLYESLLKRTETIAIERAQTLRLPHLLRWPALARHLLLALLLLASIGGFAVINRTAWSLWTSRLFLQTDRPWPRRASLEVLDFVNGRRKVAEGADLMIRVRANARLRTPPPEICIIDYRLESGQQGRVNMVREGEPVDGFQYYRYEGQPFQGMLETVEFDVLGLDARVANRRVDVVPSPSIADVQLDCVFPAYTKLPPRRQAWRAGTSLPAGTQVRLSIASTKPLREAHILDLNTQKRQQITIASKQTVPPTGQSNVGEPAPQADANGLSFRFALPPLKETQAVEIELLDQDDVTSQKPYRLAIQVIEDQPPQLALTLQGIGTAITSDARLSITGTLEDDYGVAENWFQIERARAEEESSSKRFPLPLPERDQFQQVLDLRQVRQSQDGWQVEPGDKLVLSVRASDECDLGEKKQEGQSDPWPLDVVSADELLALLEARELNLKRRFEQVLVEMTDTRDSLLRLQASLTESQPAVVPGSPADGSTTAQGDPSQNPTNGSSEVESTEPKPTEADPARSEAATETDDTTADANQPTVLRLLRVQRAQQQGAKSQQEVAGVASAFADIREELINNRVDTPERRDRLQRDIIQPLDLIVSDQFARWHDQLRQLEQRIDGPDAAELSTATLQQTNELIYSLQQVLEKMLELETYNELVDLVRSIAEEQSQLLEKTKEERKRQARALLED